jgi:hypothetical protein
LRAKVILDSNEGAEDGGANNDYQLRKSRLKEAYLGAEAPSWKNIIYAALKRVRENLSFAPLGLVCFPLFPTCAVGCILTPLRG